MENKDLEGSSPIHNRHSKHLENDEISLVDLALILISRRKVVGIVFVLFFGLGVVYSFSQTDNITTHYQYETTIVIGSRTAYNETLYLEPPITLLSNIQYLYAPLVLAEFEGEYEITAETLKGSGIIIITTTSSTANDTTAIGLLTSLSNRAIKEHNSYYESIQTSLKNIENPENPTDVAIQLASLKKSTTLDTPRSTEIKTATSIKTPKLIFIISIFGGLLFAIFAAFIAEFISKVKNKNNSFNSQ